MEHRVRDTRDSLAEAKAVCLLKGEAQRREDELLRAEYRDIEQLGERAVNIYHVSRETLVLRAKSAMGRAYELARGAGFAKPSVPANPSDRDRSRFKVASSAVLINDGAVALRLAFSGHGPDPLGQDFWKLLEEDGIEAAVMQFNGVYTPSVLATDPSTGGRVAEVHLAPQTFSAKDVEIKRRFDAGSFPFSGVTPLMSPYGQCKPVQPAHPDMSHVSQEGLIWGAGLEARFSQHLDLFARGDQPTEQY